MIPDSKTARWNAAALPILIFAFQAPLAGQAQFIRLGARNTYVGGISGDGTIVVGSRSPQTRPAFRWTAASGCGHRRRRAFRPHLARRRDDHLERSRARRHDIGGDLAGRHDLEVLGGLRNLKP